LSFIFETSSGKTVVSTWANIDSINGMDMAFSPMPMAHDMKGEYLLHQLISLCAITFVSYLFVDTLVVDVFVQVI
jgi:hypothetical protein